MDAYAALRAAGAPLAVPVAVPSHRAWAGTLAADGRCCMSAIQELYMRLRSMG